MLPEKNGAARVVSVSAPHNRNTPNTDRHIAAAAQKQARERLLDIKRGSLWTVATWASAYLDSLLSSLEDDERDEIFPCAKAFVEHARAVAALVTDFEAERKRGRRRQ